MMMATGYLEGNQYDTGDSNHLVFKAVGNREFWILFLSLFLLLFFCYYLIGKLHTNYWSVKKRRLRKKLLLLLVCLCLLPITVSCGKGNKTNDLSVYNAESMVGETSEYLVYTQDTESGVQIICEDKKSGKVFSAIKNPFEANSEILDKIYCTKDEIYYLRFNYSTVGFFGQSQDHVSLVKIDAKDFTESVIYEEKMNSDTVSKEENGYAQENSFDFYNGLSGFYIQDSVFYGIENNEVIMMNLITGKKRTILKSPDLNSISFKQNCIYYINEYSNIVCYNIKRKKKVIYDDIAAKSFQIFKNKLYYVNLKDYGKLYEYDRNTETNRKITDEGVLSFDCDDTYVFYKSSADTYEYRIYRKGNGRKLITKKTSYTEWDIPQYKYMIYVEQSDKGTKLWKIDRKTLKGF